MSNEKKRVYGRCYEKYLDAKLRLCLREMTAGEYSSKHVHDECADQVIVAEGRLQLRTFNDPRDYEYEQEILTPGHATAVVASGVVHQLCALSYVILHELYIANPGCFINPRDIHRYSERGALNDRQLEALCDRIESTSHN